MALSDTASNSPGGHLPMTISDDSDIINIFLIADRTSAAYVYGSAL